MQVMQASIYGARSKLTQVALHFEQNSSNTGVEGQLDHRRWKKFLR